MPKVSIIIPCYNLGQFLDEAVDSVLSQTFEDFEIIIINDGSTDKYTNELLHDYRRPKTTVLSTENQGLPSARNNGIKASKGKYICCLDADDKYHPDFIKKTTEVLDRDGDRETGFVTTWLRTFGDEDYQLKMQGYDPARLAIENIVHVASLFRRECWEQAGGYAPNLRLGYEDWNFWISIAALGYKWTCIEEVLFYYRRRKQSMLSSSDQKRDFLFSTIIDNNKAFYDTNAKEILLHATNELSRAWKTWEETNRRLIAAENKAREAENFNILRNQVNDITNSLTYQVVLKIGLVLNLLFPMHSSRRKSIIYMYGLLLKASELRHSKTIVNQPWNKGTPLISVIIPCYNYGRYIEESIDSVLDQSFQNFEIIVVDGGSTDEETIERLHALKKPKTTVYFRTERHLAGSNRNFGIEKARGKYICCLDADDLLRPTYLEKALFYLEKYNYEVVYPSLQSFGDDDLVWRVNSAHFLHNIEVGNEVSTVAVFEKAVWETVGGYKDWPPGEKHVPEDWEFWTRVLGNGFRFKRLKEPLLLYRVHGAGLTAQCGTSLQEQKAIIRKENETLLTRDNLRFIKNRTAIHYSVKDPYVNLKEDRQSDRKNVLFLLPFMIIGGADKVLLTVAQHMSQNGFHLSMLTTEKTDPAFGDNTKAYEQITENIYHLDSFLENQREWKDFLFYLIEAKNIDLLFLVGSEFAYALLPEIRKKYPHLRIIDQQFNEFGHIENNRKHAKYIDMNIVASVALRNILVDQYKEKPDKVKVIVHGVDTEIEFNPEKIDLLRDRDGGFIPPGKFVISFIGRFSVEKSPGLFVDIANVFKQDENIFFVMIGNGPEYSRVKNKIKDLRLQTKFYVPGFIDDIRPILKKTDVLLIPSQIEGIPIILLEALSVGVPVIASSVGGIPSVIQNGHNGFLCNKGDVQSFVTAINLVYGDSNMKNQIAKNARTYAIDNISLARMNDQYLTVFRKVLTS